MPGLNTSRICCPNRVAAVNKDYGRKADASDIIQGYAQNCISVLLFTSYLYLQLRLIDESEIPFERGLVYFEVICNAVRTCHRKSSGRRPSSRRCWTTCRCTVSINVVFKRGNPPVSPVSNWIGEADACLAAFSGYLRTFVSAVGSARDVVAYYCRPRQPFAFCYPRGRLPVAHAAEVHGAVQDELQPGGKGGAGADALSFISLGEK